MTKKVVAIVGSYRKGGTVDSAVEEILTAAKEKGASTHKIDLLDKRIEFCTNCRSCTQAEGLQRGTCVQKDELEAVLTEIENADAVILGAPVNFYNVSALFRRFMERLVGYAYWPWGKPSGPALRTKERKKKAVLVTSAGMPAFLIPLATGAPRALKTTAKTLGAKTVGSLWIGLSAMTQKQTLSKKTVAKARKLGHQLAG
jgi:multimeric flavodoxin WrbA